MAENLDLDHSRINLLLDYLTRMGQGQSQLQIPITKKKDLLDAIGFGINMLAAELRYTSISRDEFKHLFDTVFDLLVVVDREGLIVQVNQAVKNLTGETSDYWVGNPWHFLFMGTGLTFKDLAGRLFAGEKMIDLEWFVRSSKGEAVPILVSAAALGSIQHGSHLVFIARDMRSTLELLQRKAEIEAEKRKAAEFKRARDLAEEATRSKDVFLANVSHELRTPLTVVLSCAELLTTQDLPQNVREKYLQRIYLSANKLRLMVSDLLDTASIESGNLAIRKGIVSLNHVIRDVYSNHEAIASSKGLRLLVMREEQIPDFVETDSLRFQQVLDNLLGNALKFTSRGEVIIKISFGIREEGCEKVVRIRVVDSGIGIAPNQQGYLFKPFSQANNQISKTYGGTGLGLALSQKLAQLLSGDLKLLWSEPGKGSCFEFWIPVGRVCASDQSRGLG